MKMAGERSVNGQKKRDSQLFTLRVWEEALGNGRIEIRGTLKHILSGETYHFCGWPALAQTIEQFLVDKKVDVPGGES